jgi:hypothetical protein
MPGSQHVLTCFHGEQGVLLNCNSRWCVSDPLPPSAALPLTEGENKSNLPFVRGRRQRSERGGRSHTILNSWLQSPEPLWLGTRLH